MSKALLHDPTGFARMEHEFASVDTAFTVGHSLFISGVPTQDSIDLLTAAISDALVANLLTFFSTEVTYKNGSLVLSDGTSEIVGTSTINAAGSRSGHVAPLSAALVASIRTGDHYRGGHGRSYFAGFAADDTDTDRLWDASLVGSFETGWAAYCDSVASLTQDDLVVVFIGVVHRFRHKAELDPHTMSPLVGTKVQRRICSQRRRLGRLV